MIIGKNACMSVHIQSINMYISDVVVNRRFELQVDVNDVMQNKPKTYWASDDKKKVQYDLK